MAHHEIPLVDISISFRSGSSLESDAKLGSTRLFARMLRRGAGKRTSDDIEATLDRLRQAALDDPAKTYARLLADREFAPFAGLLPPSREEAILPT